MSVDISTLDVEELKKLIKTAEKRIDVLVAEKKKNLLKQFKELAKSEGLEIEDVLPDTKKKTTRRKPAKKSASVDDQGQDQNQKPEPEKKADQEPEIKK